MPKTATKTLQREYFSSHDSIVHVGKNKETPRDWEESLIDKIVDTERYEWSQVRGTVPDITSHISKEDSPIIISAESFSTGTSRPPKVDRFTIAERLGLLYPDASIILTVREQIDILQSIFLQRLEPVNLPSPGRQFLDSTWRAKFKGNIQNEFENWIDDMLYGSANTSNELDYYDYSDLIDIYNTFFDDVYILLFEKLKEDMEGFINELSAILNIESQPELIGQSKRNPRLTIAHLWWLKFSTAIPHAQNLLDFIPENTVDLIRNHSRGLKITPTVQQEKKLRDYYAPGNRRLQRITGIDISRYGYATS